jgi:hypothetical protein
MAEWWARQVLLLRYLESEDAGGPAVQHQVTVTTHRPPGLYEELTTRRFEAEINHNAIMRNVTPMLTHHGGLTS